MATIDGKSFKDILNDAIRAANELGYGEEVVTEVKKAKTEAEITSILSSARHRGHRAVIADDPRYYKF